MNLNLPVALFNIVVHFFLDFFLQIQPGYMSLNSLCFDFFSLIFLVFWGGSMGQSVCKDYIAFRGSHISCRLACVLLPGPLGHRSRLLMVPA